MNDSKPGRVQCTALQDMYKENLTRPSDMDAVRELINSQN